MQSGNSIRKNFNIYKTLFYHTFNGNRNLKHEFLFKIYDASKQNRTFQIYSFNNKKTIFDLIYREYLSSKLMRQQQKKPIE